MLTDQGKYVSRTTRDHVYRKRILVYDMAVGLAVVGLFVILKFQKCVLSRECDCGHQDAVSSSPKSAISALQSVVVSDAAAKGITSSSCCKPQPSLSTIPCDANVASPCTPWVNIPLWRDCLLSQLKLANLFLLLHVFVAATWPGVCCQLPPSALTLLRIALVGGRIALVGRQVFEAMLGLRYLWDGISVFSSALLFPVAVPLHAPLALLQWLLLLQPLVSETMVLSPALAVRVMALNFLSGVIMPTVIMVLLDKYRACRVTAEESAAAAAAKSKADYIADGDSACCSSHLSFNSRQTKTACHIDAYDSHGMYAEGGKHSFSPQKRSAPGFVDQPSSANSSDTVSQTLSHKVAESVSGSMGPTARLTPLTLAGHTAEERLAELRKLCSERYSLPLPQSASNQKRSSLYKAVAKTSLISVKVSGPGVDFHQHAPLLLQAVRDRSSALLPVPANIGCCAVPGCVQLLLPVVEYNPPPIQPVAVDLGERKSTMEQVLNLVQDAVKDAIPGPPPSISIWCDDGTSPGSNAAGVTDTTCTDEESSGSEVAEVLSMTPFCLAVDVEQLVCVRVSKDRLVLKGHDTPCTEARVVVGGASGSVVVDTEVAVEDAPANTCYIRFTVPAQQQCGTALQLLILPTATHRSPQVYINTPLLVLTAAAQVELAEAFTAVQAEIEAERCNNDLDRSKAGTGADMDGSAWLQQAAWRGAMAPLLSDIHAVLQLCKNTSSREDPGAPVLLDLLESVMEYLWQQDMLECLTCIMEAVSNVKGTARVSAATSKADTVAEETEGTGDATNKADPAAEGSKVTGPHTNPSEAAAEIRRDGYTCKDSDAGPSSSGHAQQWTPSGSSCTDEIANSSGGKAQAAAVSAGTLPGRLLRSALGYVHPAVLVFQETLNNAQSLAFVGMTEGRRWRAATLCSLVGFNPGLEDSYEVYRLLRSQALDACCMVFYSAVLSLTCAKAARSGNRLTVTYLVGMVLPHFFLLLLPHLVARRRRPLSSIPHGAVGDYDGVAGPPPPAQWLDAKLEQMLQSVHIGRGTLLNILRLILHYFVYKMHINAGIVSLYILSLTAVTVWDVILRYSFLMLHAEGRAKRCS